MKLCPKCGAELENDARFCTSCGTNITPGTSMPPKPSSPFDREPAEQKTKQQDNFNRPPQRLNQQEPKQQQERKPIKQTTTPHRPPTKPIAIPPGMKQSQQKPQKPMRRPPIKQTQQQRPTPSIAGRPVQKQNRPKRQPSQPRFNEESKRKIGAIALVFIVIAASAFVFLFVTGFGGILGDKAKFVCDSSEAWEFKSSSSGLSNLLSGYSSSNYYNNYGSSNYHLCYSFDDDGTVLIDVLEEDNPNINFNKISSEDYTFNVSKVTTGEEDEDDTNTQNGQSERETLTLPIKAYWKIENGELYISPRSQDLEKNGASSLSSLCLQGLKYNFYDNDECLTLRNSDSTQVVNLHKTSKSDLEDLETIKEKDLLWKNINFTATYYDYNIHETVSVDPENIVLIRNGDEKADSYSTLHAPSSWGEIKQNDKIKIKGSYDNDIDIEIYWRPTGDYLDSLYLYESYY